MLDAHRKTSALATLAVRERRSSRQLLFDANGLLAGRRINEVDTLVSSANSVAGNVGTPACVPVSGAELHPTSKPPAAEPEHRPLAAGLQRLAFSGIHFISPRLLPLITESGVFSIIDTYLRLAKANEKISAFRADSFYWRDLGRLEDLRRAADDLHLGLPCL
jgi:hypothetical protein